MVVKMERGRAVIKRCSDCLTPHSKKQVLQALDLSNLDYCPVVWSSAARKDLLAQNRAARFALNHIQMADINTMHASLSWLRVEERLTASFLIFIRIVNVEIVCVVNLHTALTHTLIPPDMPPGVFSQSPNPEQIQENIHYYKEQLLNFLPSHIAQINSKPGLLNRSSNTSRHNASALFELDSLCV